jgi:hypothetical protein
MTTKMRKFEVDILDEKGNRIGGIVQDKVDPSKPLIFHPDIDLSITQLSEVVKELNVWQRTYNKLNAVA